MERQNATVAVTGTTGNPGPYVVEQLGTRGATAIGTYVSDTERTAAEERPDRVIRTTGGQSEAEV